MDLAVVVVDVDDFGVVLWGNYENSPVSDVNSKRINS